MKCGVADVKENTIFVKRYAEDDAVFPVNEQEIWRYSGYRESADTVENTLKNLLKEVREELKTSFSFKVCYRRVGIAWKDGMPMLPFASESKELAKCLEGCREVVLFAATIGLGLDRYLARQQRISPTKALLAQAYGAERIEALCDVFCGEMEEVAKKDGLSCTMRFSPGYGDLPLTAQKDFFRLLDCNRQIGVSLNDSLLMTPSKSVTAILGLREEKGHDGVGVSFDIESKGALACAGHAQNKCVKCPNVDCEYRRMK